jgi:hypothetical protein
MKWIRNLLFAAGGIGMAATAAAVPMTSATITWRGVAGEVVGTSSDVTGFIGGGVWSVASTTPFFGANWIAHDGTTFGPGTYTFDTIEGGAYTGIVVGPGQVGGHILFDYGPSLDQDIVNVWDVMAVPGGWQYTSVDFPAGNPPNPDGVPGIGLIDGPFPGVNWNFDFTVAVPEPLSMALVGSGLAGLVGFRRRKRG